MKDTLLSNESLLRFAAFAGVLAAMAIWELLALRRPQQIGRGWRWPNNLAVIAIDALLVRLVFPMTAVGFAALVESKGWGVLQILSVPIWLAAPLAVLVLDLAIYLQHVAFHAVPVLWRLHRMHHADLEVDVTTGIRFHPNEILLSMVLKFAVIAALGAPAAGVFLFDVLLNATSLFNHGNVRLPASLDRVLRWVIVTPDMHRVHHSIERRETDSNFGFNLPWWDRLFGTYRDQPARGHEAMTLGIDRFRDPAELRIERMLHQPFRDPVDAGQLHKQG